MKAVDDSITELDVVARVHTLTVTIRGRSPYSAVWSAGDRDHVTFLADPVLDRLGIIGFSDARCAISAGPASTAGRLIDLNSVPSLELAVGMAPASFNVRAYLFRIRVHLLYSLLFLVFLCYLIVIL